MSGGNAVYGLYIHDNKFLFFYNFIIFMFYIIHYYIIIQFYQ